MIRWLNDDENPVKLAWRMLVVEQKLPAFVSVLFGFDVGIKHFKDLTNESLFSQRSKLCSLCGHFHTIGAKEQRTSKTWADACHKNSE